MVRVYATRLIMAALRKTGQDAIGRTAGDRTVRAILLLAGLAASFFAASMLSAGSGSSALVAGASLAAALLLVVAALLFILNLLLFAPYRLWRTEYRSRREMAARLKRFLEPVGPAPSSDRISLTAALLFASFGDWEKPIGDLKSHEETLLASSLVDFQQLASDGALTIWGRSNRHNGVHRPLPRDIWAEQQIEWFSMLDGDPATEYIGSPVGAAHGRCYGLMVSKAQVEHIRRSKGPSARAA